MDFPLRTLDLYGGANEADGRPLQINVKLGSTEWSRVEALAQKYGFARSNMARRLICFALGALEKA